MKNIKVLQSFIPKEQHSLYLTTDYDYLFIFHILEDQTVTFTAECVDGVTRTLNVPFRAFEKDFNINLEDLGYTFCSKKESVDFELANNTFNTMLNYFKQHIPAMADETQNLQIFFTKLSESSSFAHKAHKELKKSKQSF